MKLTDNLIALAKEIDTQFVQTERVTWAFIEKRDDFWDKVFRQAKIKPKADVNYMLDDNWELKEIKSV